ncbi:hypothetical protein [Nocardia brasiliensis]|uniref:hypothetical protein n=1 Tax=Nocardia brasiliensis TaxID=37326 RepID=UPI002456651C|nr:hypothetical protein [Nocardia brasiliensis]
MQEAREVGVVPEWVGAVAASERKRIPVGEISAWCRTPHANHMGRYAAREGQTLSDIAAEALPMRCLACWTEHSVSALRIAQWTATGVEVSAEHIGEVAEDKLDRVACPACGTVGLWPPVRPEKELHWANEALVETYGWFAPLPEGEEVLVPELCGHECVQLNEHGPATTFCGPDCPRCAEEGNTAAHVGRKSDRARKTALRNATTGIRPQRRPVDLDAAAQALAEATDAPAMLTLVPEAAPMAEEERAEDGAGVEHPEALAAPPAAEPRAGGVSGRDSAALAAGAALVAQLSAVAQLPAGIPAGAASGDAYRRAWSSLTAGVRALAEAVKHTGNAEQAMEELAAQRAEFQQRAERAEAATSVAEEKLATVRANAEAAVTAAQEQATEAEEKQVAAQSRADTLAEQLAALQQRYDDLTGAAGAGGWRQMLEEMLDDAGTRRAGARKMPRQRLSQPQKDMLALIAGNQADAAVVARVADPASPGNSVWFVRGVEAADGELKTLKSLQSRGLVTWWEFNAEGVAPAALTVAGEQVSGARAGEVPAASERAAESEPGGSTAAPKMMRGWWEQEDGEPSEEALDTFRKKVRARVVTRAEAAGSGGRSAPAWRVSNAEARNPETAALDWMLARGLIRVAEDGIAHVVE